MRLFAECVLSRSLVHHPRRYPGEGAVRLHDHRELYTAVLEPLFDLHLVAEPRMEPVVDPSLNKMFVGNMSPFRDRPAANGCRDRHQQACSRTSAAACAGAFRT
jgi:hypothetical protein